MTIIHSQTRKARRLFVPAVLLAAFLLCDGAPAFSQRPADAGSEATIVIETVQPERRDAGSLIEVYGLTRADYTRIAKKISNIRRAIPIRDARKQARVGRKTADVLLRGTVPAYGETGRVNVRRGRFLLDKDQKRRNNVAVIGPDVARSLFGFKDPLGKNILIGREFFLVVGVATEADLPEEHRAAVYVPSSAMQWRLGDVEMRLGEDERTSEQYELSRIEVNVKDVERIRETAESVQRVLRAYHKKGDFTVTIRKPKNAR